MITEVVGNLLETDKCDVIVHQANLFHTFGAGIARAIRERFPEAYEADLKTAKGDMNKLGTYSVAKITKVNDPKPTSIKFIVNLYSQNGLGGQDRQTSYDAMARGLSTLQHRLSYRKDTLTLGVPFQLGCGLANGDWIIVRAIIESVFAKSRIPVIIYTLPELAKGLDKSPSL